VVFHHGIRTCIGGLRPVFGGWDGLRRILDTIEIYNEFLRSHNFSIASGLAGWLVAFPTFSNRGKVNNGVCIEVPTHPPNTTPVSKVPCYSRKSFRSRLSVSKREATQVLEKRS
jgi:hypothetical protein